MSFLNFYGGTTQWLGALATLISNWTHGSDPVNWDGADIYDVGGWHDPLSNNTRMTVPSGVSLVRVTSSIRSPNIPTNATTKNGAVFRGRTLQKAAVGNVIGGISAPIAVSAADYFESLSNVDVTDEGRSWFSIEKLEAALKYALVYRSTTLSLSAGVAALVAWDSEVADTDAWHDNSTNPSRLTVPTGVTLVRLCANIDTSSATQLVRMTILKNGAAVVGVPFVNQEQTAVQSLNCVTAPLVVTPGDYFELSVLASSARTLQNTEPVWFSIEEYPSSYRRALACKSATQSYTAASEAAIQWDGADIYDTNSMHDPASNNTRMTVPAGVTQAKLSFSIVTPSATGTPLARVTKNGSAYDGMPSYNTGVTGADALNAIGAWVSVVAGDYFECLLTTGANLTLAARADLWFCMECR